MNTEVAKKENSIKTAKEFASDQEVRWCPGCGDFAILAQVQKALAELNRKNEEVVFISGIGCASRFSYYMNTYGLHGIHGRPIAIATGLKITRPELDVWVITGDGDCLSIGGNHMIHGLRRNVGLHIIMFNNRIYGLTKGQYSPTSEQGKVTFSTPYGSLDHPVNPLSLALGSDACWVARTIDRNLKHMNLMIKEAAEFKGASFLEVYQNCKIFNDEAFARYSEKDQKDWNTVYAEHGKPLTFGPENECVILFDNGKPVIVNTKNESVAQEKIWIHDETDKQKAFLLSQFSMPGPYENFPAVFGIIYKESRSTYEELLENKIEELKNKKPPVPINQLLKGSQTWEIA